MAAPLFFFFFSQGAAGSSDEGETRRRRRRKRRRLVIDRPKPEPVAEYYEPPAPIVPLLGGVQPSLVLPALPMREGYAAPLPDPAVLLGRAKARADQGDKVRKLIALLMATEPE